MKILYTNNWHYVIDLESAGGPDGRYFVGSTKRGGLVNDIKDINDRVVSHFNLTDVRSQNLPIPEDVQKAIERAKNSDDKYFY